MKQNTYVVGARAMSEILRVLRPLAQIAGEYDKAELPSNYIVMKLGKPMRACLTLGDCRRARTLLQIAEGKK